MWSLFPTAARFGNLTPTQGAALRLMRGRDWGVWIPLPKYSHSPCVMLPREIKDQIAKVSIQPPPLLRLDPAQHEHHEPAPPHRDTKMQFTV